jgi:hypothetical protein
VTSSLLKSAWDNVEQTTDMDIAARGQGNEEVFWTFRGLLDPYHALRCFDT